MQTQNRQLTSPSPLLCLILPRGDRLHSPFSPNCVYEEKLKYIMEAWIYRGITSGEGKPPALHEHHKGILFCYFHKGRRDTGAQCGRHTNDFWIPLNSVHAFPFFCACLFLPVWFQMSHFTDLRTAWGVYHLPTSHSYLPGWRHASR